MAPDLSEKLLGIDIDDADRTRDADGDDGEQERLAQFVFVGVGEHRLALPVDAVRTLAEPPADLTRVPRSPPAIEGLMDLRGEITAVIDPTVHFPVTETRSGRERLLVLDRSSDQQSVAIRVDDVIGVETIPESDILEGDAVETSDLSGDALEHPLIVALVTQEREPRADLGSAVADDPADDAASVTAAPGAGGLDAAGGSAVLSSARGTDSGIGESVGEAFEVEPTADDTADADDQDEGDESTREIVVEATAVIDIDRLLQASGHSE
ncbi:chemotaxis protein CheW [Natrinema versiforme]|uniref:Chemotaxis protein CheW n=1 Tax=Natrinema versiforme TaxID=88724 RepID=A0A4P8WI04_9EURY|nr:chemotaxis protein CheW [Natrinema versiforme]QCS43097.1 chemotaxis protein CheW [Natrinema versiforme]